MTQRYFRRTADNILVQVVFNDNIIPPDGMDAINAADVVKPESCPIQIGGTWDGTTYTPPPGQYEVLDISTTLGKLKAAATAQRERIIDLEQELAHLGYTYPVRDINIAHDFLSYAHWGSRAVFMSSTLTATEKLGWVTSSALGPADLPLTEIYNFFNIVHGWTDDEVAERCPKARILFASPVDPYTRYNIADAKSSTDALTNLADDPTDNTEIEKIRNGSWINDITDG